jgi:predicted dehydrogenase/nucleoside-diphosphate-sugar epimerase/glycosyltransferase involved in cell wall biosynthesis
MPRPIIALSKDWDDDPTSNHHVLRELARTRRVLWLNSVAARSIDLSNGRDLRRIARKLHEFARGPVNVEHDLWVFTPLVIPLPHIPAVRRLNAGLLRVTLRALRRRLRLSDFQLWTFLPNAAPYLGMPDESLSVYYCVDEHSLFSSLDRERTASAERELLERVDMVFAINEPLAELKRAVNPETHLALHGVDQARFAAALDPATQVPADIADLPRPVLGFYGALQTWVDLDLIAEVARRRPEWSIVLIGQEQSDTTTVRGLPNVHLLGRRRNDELPAYCKAFDVGLIPYRLSEQLAFRNPIKLREYLSAGLPVVSTPIPDVRRYGRWCAIADDPAAFVQSVEVALAGDTPELREERSRAMKDESWTARVAEIDRAVREVSRRREAPGTGQKRDMTHESTTQARFRAGMVGAGNICQHHVSAVQALTDVELVGVTDLDAARAEHAAQEWGTKAYPSLRALVEAGANVIHVLTPPSTHAAVALEALELGCHVLVEKPLAESPEDARRIGEVAREKGLVATVDHSLLYDPQVMIALDRVRAGALGDIVAVDIFQSSEYPPYEGGRLPPQYRDAAYPWRDIGVHCMYLIQEFLGTIEDVDAEWASIGGDRNLAFDEWRALVRCERGIGHFHLSWNVRPQQSQIIVQGTHGVTRIDLFAMFQGRRADTPLPKAAERVVNAYKESLRPLAEVPASVWKFLRKDIQPFQGLRNLVGDFYTRLAAGDPPPVSIEDAAVSIEWIEKVARAAEADHTQRLSRFEPAPTAEFLVTGASGAVGSAVVDRLLADGRQVRALVRRVPERPIDGVDYVIGNLGDPDAIDRAVRGAERIIHAGAAMSGGWPEHYGSTVVGTRNIVEAARRHDVRQLVYVSSMSVVDMAGAVGEGPVSESTPLEPRADERGAYTQAKLEAELEVTKAAQAGLPCVIFRPGVIFGGGIPLMNGSVARRAGSRWVILGDGRLVLPLIYMDDVVDAIMAAVDRNLVSGEVIQLIDREQLTQEEILAAVNGDDKRVRVPRPVVFALGKLSEYPLGALGRPSPLAVYRLKSALARLTYESDRAEQLLGWQPRVGVREGIRRETTRT